MIYDLTTVFTEGLSLSRQQTGLSDFPWEQIRESLNITCDSDDQAANWYSVYDAIISEEIAFISKYYPVVLVKESCPVSFLEILKHHGLLTVALQELFSCDAEILKHYVRNKMILDDRSVNDKDFAFDQDWKEYIQARMERKLSYITPYCFTFQEIR